MSAGPPPGWKRHRMPAIKGVWKDMAEECVEAEGSGWKRFLKNHWGMAVAWGAAARLSTCTGPSGASP